MPVIKVSATAEDDLKEIWTHVAEDDADTATNVIKEVIRKFATLRDHPQMGRGQNELLVNLRSFPVKNYIIFYQPFEGGIEILRVLHSSRDIESIFESFFDSL